MTSPSEEIDDDTLAAELEASTGGDGEDDNGEDQDGLADEWEAMMEDLTTSGSSLIKTEMVEIGA